MSAMGTQNPTPAPTALSRTQLALVITLAVMATLVLALLIFGRGSTKEIKPSVTVNVPKAKAPSVHVTAPVKIVTVGSSGSTSMPSGSTGGGSQGQTGGSSTGGSSTQGGTPSGASTTTPAVPPKCVGTTPDEHGLIIEATLVGPVTEGSQPSLTVTVCKVTGDPVALPVMAIKTSWDQQATSSYANLHWFGGDYTFLDESRNWFQLPSLSQGDVWEFQGKVDVPARGDNPGTNFCISPVLEEIGDQPVYDANNQPIPDWTAPSSPTYTCQRVSYTALAS